MTDSEFWTEVQRRRNHFFYWWLGWPFAGITATLSYQAIIGKEPSFGFMMGVMFTWYVGWLLINRRLTGLLCPNCSKPAIPHVYFFMKHAKCQHCGLKYGSDERPTRQPEVEYQAGKYPTLIIRAIWAYGVVSGAAQGWALPSSPVAQFAQIPTLLAFFPYLLLIATQIGPISTQGFLSAPIDKRFGVGTYAYFIRTLKPRLLFSVFGFEIGIIGLIRSILTHAGRPAYVICGFFLNAGVVFLVMHILAEREERKNESTKTSA